MSIRAEDAAAEASRFSLRTSLFGDGALPQTPPRAPHAPTALTAATAGPPAGASFAPHANVIRPLAMAPMTATAPTTPAPAGTALTFSFNSINSQRGGAAHQQQQQQQLKAKQTQETLQAIARIAQQQRIQPTPTPMMPTAPTSAGATARTLPSGFLNGGNQRMDAPAEVMRLAATVDSLNSKLGSQSDRLQRTEASLVRANRSMTSERATANARLLRMQNEVKDLKGREASLRENAVAQARRELRKSDSAFGESVKRAEEFDAKLTTLQGTIRELTGERDALSNQISGLAVELKQSNARAAEVETRLAEVPDPSVAEAKVAAALATLREETTQRKAIDVQLREMEAKHDAVMLQLEEAKAQASTACAEASAARMEVAETAAEAEVHALARAKLQDEVTQLLSQKQEIATRLEKEMATRACVAGGAAATTHPRVVEAGAVLAQQEALEPVGAVAAVAEPTEVEPGKAVETTAATAPAAATEPDGGDEITFEGGTSDESIAEVNTFMAPPDFLELTTEQLKGQLEEVEIGLEALFKDLDSKTNTELYTETGKLAKRRQALDAELQSRCPPSAPPLAVPLSLPVVGSTTFACFYGEMPRTDGHSDELSRDYENEQEHAAEDAESTDACPRSTIVFQSEPTNLHAHLPFHAHAQHGVKARLDACFRASEYETRLVRRPIYPSQFPLGMQHVDTDAVVAGAATGEIPPEVAALIGAVSSDISDAVRRARVAIQQDLGVPKEEIEKELSMYV